MANLHESSVRSGSKLTVRDIAERENVSQRTVLNWVQRGILEPCYKVGRIIRFDENYMDQLRKGGE